VPKLPNWKGPEAQNPIFHVPLKYRAELTMCAENDVQKYLFLHLLYGSRNGFDWQKMIQHLENTHLLDMLSCCHEEFESKYIDYDFPKCSKLVNSFF
jgi:hypothetical protein